MFGRNAVFLLLLAGAVVGPMVYFNGVPNMLSVQDVNYSNGSTATMPAGSPATFNLSPNAITHPVSTIPVAPQTPYNEISPARVNAFASPPASPFPTDVVLPGNANGPDFNAVPLEFMPVTNLGEILRFDANPSWVRQRWDRVSVVRSNGSLKGFRVPLVTGVNTSDLFGSLTYFFDSNQNAQKLTFRGWTGDPDGLVQFLTQHYKFKKQPTSAAGLYIAKSWRKSTGALYMQHPNQISSNNPTQQVAILLEMNNPDGPYELSTEVASMVFNSQR